MEVRTQKEMLYLFNNLLIFYTVPIIRSCMKFGAPQRGVVVNSSNLHDNTRRGISKEIYRGLTEETIENV